jgi:signal peptidase II
MKLSSKAVLLIGLILFIDQASKIYIKTHFHLGEEINVIGSWFRLHFTENNGMAFGMEFGGSWGKLALSIFRIIAVSAIGWYIVKLVKDKTMPAGLVLGISAIFAGALGNIADSVFYGVIFSESSWRAAAEFMPAAGGYAPPLFGRVVDMLYFPLIEGYFPSWSPFWAGEHFLFFRPVFNVADSAITLGVSYLLLFQREFLKKL